MTTPGEVHEWIRQARDLRVKITRAEEAKSVADTQLESANAALVEVAGTSDPDKVNTIIAENNTELEARADSIRANLESLEI